MSSNTTDGPSASASHNNLIHLVLENSAVILQPLYNIESTSAHGRVGKLVGVCCVAATLASVALRCATMVPMNHTITTTARGCSP